MSYAFKCVKKPGSRVRLKVLVSEADLKVPTITDLYASANWLEREVYDQYGIVFEGHPDLRRIFLDKDFVYLKEDSQLGNNAQPGPLPVRSKIGFNSTENCRTFAFQPDQKPCLAVDPWEDKSFLENEPAIRRAAKKD